MGRALDCTDEVIAGPAEYTIRDESGISSPNSVFGQEHEAVGEGIPGVTTNTSLVTITRPAPIMVPPAQALAYPPGHNSLLSSKGAKVQGSPYVALPPFSAQVSLVPPRIPPEPHVTLLTLGAGRFQLSDAALGELDMKLYASLRCSSIELIRPFSRLNTLCRLNKMGILFTSQKQQALLRGDTSGTIIHPLFISAAQSLGMNFCKGVGDLPVMIKRQARHMQRALELFVDIFKGHDLELIARAALWVVAGAIIMPVTRLNPLHIKRSCEAIETAGLRFIPTYGRPPEFSEDLHERLSLLSQAIYFENYLFLTHSGAEPKMTARLEKEFRHQLQVRSGSPPFVTLHAQCVPIGGLSGVVQDLSVDHADPDHSVRQRHDACTRPSSNRRYALPLSVPSAPTPSYVR